MTRAHGPGELMVLVPAYNEQGAVASVVAEVMDAVPGAPVLVVDDCSEDATAAVACAAGARVLSLPHHLGLGGCVQAGYRLAHELGYEYVIRVDGDGESALLVTGEDFVDSVRVSLDTSSRAHGAPLLTVVRTTADGAIQEAHLPAPTGRVGPDAAGSSRAS